MSALSMLRRVKVESKCFWVCCILLLLPLLTYLVIDYFSPIGSYYLSPLNKEDEALLQDLLGVFDRAMKAANITYFMIGGTLLGSYRHHGRIPWDDDIDFMVNVTQKEKVKSVLSKINSSEYSTYSSNSSLFFKFIKFYSKKGRTVLWKSYRTPYIDIFFYSENETHIINTSPWFSTEVFNKTEVFPLMQRPFASFWLPAPCNTANALTGIGIDVSSCQSRVFNHILELPNPFNPLILPCEQLSGMYPLVSRSETVALLDTVNINRSAEGVLNGVEPVSRRSGVYIHSGQVTNSQNSLNDLGFLSKGVFPHTIQKGRYSDPDDSADKIHRSNTKALKSDEEKLILGNNVLKTITVTGIC